MTTATTLCLCASVTAYKRLMEIKRRLESLGYAALAPDLAELMAQKSDYELAAYHNDRKTEAIRSHFNKISQADAVLIVNEPKHGLEGYIGPNVLMEMGVAFYLNKPIYVLNTVSRQLPCLDEIIALNPLYLHGDLTQLNKT